LQVFSVIQGLKSEGEAIIFPIEAAYYDKQAVSKQGTSMFTGARIDKKL
jgi:hypothetical protein